MILNKLSSFLLILLILLTHHIPKVSSSCTSNPPGCEYFIRNKHIRGNACMRNAICRWTLKYYLQNQPGVVIPPNLVIPSTADLDLEIKESMQKLDFPPVVFRPKHRTCLKRRANCSQIFRALFVTECARVLPDLMKPSWKIPRPRPKMVNPQPTTYNEFRKSLPKFNGTNYGRVTCPFYQRKWTIEKLLEPAKVSYNDTMMFPELTSMMPANALQELSCRNIRQSFRLNQIYSTDMWCNDWELTYWRYFVCIDIHNPPILPDFKKILELCKIDESRHPYREFYRVFVPKDFPSFR